MGEDCECGNTPGKRARGSWLVDRLREPSTHLGLMMLAEGLHKYLSEGSILGAFQAIIGVAASTTPEAGAK